MASWDRGEGTPSEGDERGHPRVNVNEPVHVLVDELVSLGARCWDISPGGMKLALTDPVAEGDRLTFAVELPNQKTFTLRAEVRHVLATPSGLYVAGLRWLGDHPDTTRLFEVLLLDHERAAR